MPEPGVGDRPRVDWPNPWALLSTISVEPIPYPILRAELPAIPLSSSQDRWFVGAWFSLKPDGLHVSPAAALAF